MTGPGAPPPPGAVEGAEGSRRRVPLGPSLAAVVVRPTCWPGAVLSASRLARPGWWHRPPWLPVPDPGLWALRMEVAYGRADARPSPDDLRDVVRWTGAMRRWSRR